MQPLFPYQHVSRDWLKDRAFSDEKTGFLADAPRVGKTWPTIDAARELGARSIGVVAPASVVGNWRHYLAERAPGVRAFVTSYDLAWRRELPRVDLLVADEAHLLMNPETRRTVAIYGSECDRVGGWSGKAGAVWPLSGTPTPNYADEMWPHLRALAPKRIAGVNGRPMDYYRFRARYCKVVSNKFGERVVGNQNEAELRDRMKGWILRRTWVQVSGQRRPIVAPLLVDAKWPKDIDDAVRLVSDAFARGGPEALAELLKPRPNAREHEAMGKLAKMRRAIGIAKVAPVLEVIEPAVRSGEKVVLFGSHAEVLDRLEQGVLGWGLGVARIDGGTPQARRTEIARRFREDPKCSVFVGQIIAAGAGIDLSSADWLILVEPDWVPGNNEQPIWRVFNVAKIRPVTVQFAAIAGTIDEKLQAANVRKMAGIRALFGA